MFVLDTDVVSELRKVEAGKGHPQVAAWSEQVVVGEAFIAAITIHELELGILLLERKDKRQGAMLRAWIDTRVRPEFEGRILPLDVTVALHCAKFHVPDPRPMRDALIAATASVHRMTVVTRNVRDFEPMGIEVLNPWEWTPAS